MFVPLLLHDSTTQVMFPKSIKKIFTLSFDSWTTDRKVAKNGLEFQLDNGSAHKIDSPKNQIAVDQSLARTGTSNKSKKKWQFR